MNIFAIIAVVVSALFGGWQLFKSKQQAQKNFKDKKEVAESSENERKKEAEKDKKDDVRKAEEKKKDNSSKDSVGFLNDVIAKKKGKK